MAAGHPALLWASYLEGKLNYGFHLVAPAKEPSLPILNKHYVELFRGVIPYSFDPRYPTYQLAESQIEILNYLGIQIEAEKHFIGGLVDARLNTGMPTLEQLLKVLSFIEDMLFEDEGELFLELNQQNLTRYQEVLTGLTKTENLAPLIREQLQLLGQIGAYCLPVSFTSKIINQAYFKEQTLPLVGRYCLSALNPNLGSIHGMALCYPG